MDPAEKGRTKGEEMVQDERRVSVSFTEVELFQLSEFFNNDAEALEDTFYVPISRKLFVAAAKAGLYDEVL
jgi:hypothetical protein